MKKALLIGINYRNSKHKLRGCINYVNNIEKVLINNIKFNSRNITKLTENHATTQNILNHIKSLVKNAKKGDVLYFHYSGHGSQVLNLNPETDYEPDGRDEILCPIDLNWKDRVIKDDDFKKLTANVPMGVKLTVTLDCCHSGDGIRSFENPSLWQYDIVDRYLQPPEEVVGKQLFNPSLTFNSKMLQNKYEDQVGILISGCRSDQTSADAFIDKQYQGACSYFLRKILEHYKYNITYTELVKQLNNAMRQSSFSQRPELNCSNKYKNLKFLQNIT